MPALLILLLGIHNTALAHESHVAASFSAGADSLTEGDIDARWGVAHDFPAFIGIEGGRTLIHEGGRDDSTRYGASIGYEDIFGVSARYLGIQSTNTQLATSEIGGAVSYRIVTKKRQSQADGIERSPVIQAAFDLVSLGSSGVTATTGATASSGAAVSGFRIALDSSWQFHPWILGFAEFALHSFSPTPYGEAGRSFRLLRWGPDFRQGPISQAFGSYGISLQGGAVFRIDPLMTFQFGTLFYTASKSATTGADGLSFLFRFNRAFTDDQSWIVSPSYEHLILDGNTYATYTIEVRYQLNAPYILARRAQTSNP